MSNTQFMATLMDHAIADRIARRISIGLCAALVLLLIGTGLAAQSSREAPLPGDTSAAITWSSRVIHNWYDRDKVHVFLMIDGFTVEQGGWKLSARDGVVWLDEASIGQDGVKTLGIYAEESVEVRTPGAERPRRFDSLYVTLRTTGDLERKATSGEDKELSGAGTPLYLRARRVRTDTLAAYREAPGEPPGTEVTTNKVAPEGQQAEAPTTTATPAEGEAEETVGQEIVVRPLDDVRQTRIISFLEPENPERRVTVRTGGVAVIYGDLEMKADDVVIWTNEGEARKARGLEAQVYLEGNVVINQGYRTVRATRVFYDLDRQQALILDAMISSFSRARDVPVYYYAERARQLAEGKFVADRATFTTSEFGHPHTALQGSRFQFTDLSEEDEFGEMQRRIRYDATDVVSTVRGVPVTWWPRMAGDVEQGETALRRVHLTERTNRGTGIESQWHLWKLLGVYRPPVGFERAYMNLNFYSERGPFISTDGRYSREKFFGDWLGAFVYDHGKDNVAGDSTEVPHHARGRARWRHRQFLPDDWQATIELSYISDRNFLDEWYERELKEGKDQETLLHLKKQWDRQTFSILLKGRINDFQTETESFPRIEYHLLGQPLLDDRLTYHTTNVYEYAQFVPDDQLHGSSPWTNIVDSSHEVNVPLQVGFVKVVPFADGRLGYFDHTMNDGGDRGRLYGAAGARASWYLSKVFDQVQSELWDLNRLRHVNTFDIEALVAENGLPSEKLYAYDEPGSAEPKVVRGIDRTDVYRLGWRQRWQTRRGPKQRTVDWVTFDLLMTWFGDSEPPRVAPDDDRSHNNLQADYSWQISDTTSLVGDMYYTTNDGEVRVANVGLSVIRSPRLSYYVGDRLIRGADSSILVLGFDYVINPKWKIHALQQFNLDQNNENNATRVELVRRMASWLMTISVELDPGEDEQIFFVQFQPVGVPEFRFGN